MSAPCWAVGGGRTAREASELGTRRAGALSRPGPRAGHRVTMSHADARGADGETALGARVGVAGNHASGYRMWDAHRRWVLVHPPVTQDLGTGRRLRLQGAPHQAGVRSGPHLRPRMTGVASGSAAQEGSVTRGVDTLAVTAGSLHLCLSPPAAGAPEVCFHPGPLRGPGASADTQGPDCVGSVPPAGGLLTARPALPASA